MGIGNFVCNSMFLLKQNKKKKKLWKVLFAQTFKL